MQMEERIVFLLCRRATSVCLLPLSCQIPPTTDDLTNTFRGHSAYHKCLRVACAGVGWIGRGRLQQV